MPLTRRISGLAELIHPDRIQIVSNPSTFLRL
jgi:hypothetical protein